MSFFNPTVLDQDGKNQYKIEAKASDSKGTITSFYFLVGGDTEDKAKKKVEEHINNDSYLGGDHLNWRYRFVDVDNFEKGDLS